MIHNSLSNGTSEHEPCRLMATGSQHTFMTCWFLATNTSHENSLRLRGTIICQASCPFVMISNSLYCHSKQLCSLSTTIVSSLRLAQVLFDSLQTDSPSSQPSTPCWLLMIQHILKANSQDFLGFFLVLLSHGLKRKYLFNSTMKQASKGSRAINSRAVVLNSATKAGQRLIRPATLPI